MSSLQAMEWLIQHQTDTDIDDPIPPTSANKPQDITPSQAEATLLLPADISEGVKEDLSATKKPEEHSTKVNKAKKPSRRRKWEFVPDQVVS